jgi:hypothetical protein
MNSKRKEMLLLLPLVCWRERESENRRMDLDESGAMFVF